MITDEDYKCRKWQERGGTDDTIVPPNKPCQKSRSIFSVVRIEKGTDLVRI